MSERAGIKFRAWDKEYKYMYETAWPFEHLVYVEMHDDDDTFQQFKHKMTVVNRKNFYFIVAKDIELLQFTGWYDKNGKEIYEGDLLQFSLGHRGEVVWDDITDGWRVVVGSTYNLRENDMVVIGNIYQDATLSGADGGVE